MILDVNKAFDRVEYVKLFSVFLDWGLRPFICKLLKHMFTNQSLCIPWDSEILPQNSTQNGVKQGLSFLPHCLLFI